MAGGGRGVELDPLVGLTTPASRCGARCSRCPPSRRSTWRTSERSPRSRSTGRTLGPVVAEYRKLIEKEVEADTRKLDSFEAFQRATDGVGAPPQAASRPRPWSRRDEPAGVRGAAAEVPAQSAKGEEAVIELPRSTPW